MCLTSKKNMANDQTRNWLGAPKEEKNLMKEAKHQLAYCVFQTQYALYLNITF